MTNVPLTDYIKCDMVLVEVENMTRRLVWKLLREMVLKQAPNCTFGGEVSQGEIAKFRVTKAIKQANKPGEDSQQGRL